jgi:hypothetical protein
MVTKITERDTGLKALMKRLGDGGAGEVTVGIHEEEGAAPHGDDTTVADVALFQEFGTSNQEAQPFLRTWADENEQGHREQLKSVAEQVFAGRAPNVAAAMKRFGLGAAIDLRKHMAGMPGVEEGDPTPLDDTGLLIKSVTAKVVK